MEEAVYGDVLDVLMELQDALLTFLESKPSTPAAGASSQPRGATEMTVDGVFREHCPEFLKRLDRLISSLDAVMQEIAERVTDHSPASTTTLRTLVTRKLGDIMESAHSIRVFTFSLHPSGDGAPGSSSPHSSSAKSNRGAADAGASEVLKVKQLFRSASQNVDDAQRLLRIAYPDALSASPASASAVSQAREAASFSSDSATCSLLPLYRDEAADDANDGTTAVRLSYDITGSPTGSDGEASAPRDSTNTVAFGRSSIATRDGHHSPVRGSGGRVGVTAAASSGAAPRQPGSARKVSFVSDLQPPSYASEDLSDAAPGGYPSVLPTDDEPLEDNVHNRTLRPGEVGLAMSPSPALRLASFQDSSPGGSPTVLTAPAAARPPLPPGVLTPSPRTGLMVKPPTTPPPDSRPGTATAAAASGAARGGDHPTSAPLPSSSLSSGKPLVNADGTHTTAHMQRLPGDLWKDIANARPDALKDAFTQDIMDLFNYGEVEPVIAREQITQVRFAAVEKDLCVWFQLAHRASLTAADVDLRTGLYAFPGMTSMYDGYFYEQQRRELEAFDHSTVISSSHVSVEAFEVNDKSSASASSSATLTAGYCFTFPPKNNRGSASPSHVSTAGDDAVKGHRYATTSDTADSHADEDASRGSLSLDRTTSLIPVNSPLASMASASAASVRRLEQQQQQQQRQKRKNSSAVSQSAHHRARVRGPHWREVVDYVTERVCRLIVVDEIASRLGLSSSSVTNVTFSFGSLLVDFDLFVSRGEALPPAALVDRLLSRYEFPVMQRMYYDTCCTLHLSPEEREASADRGTDSAAPRRGSHAGSSIQLILPDKDALDRSLKETSADPASKRAAQASGRAKALPLPEPQAAAPQPSLPAQPRHAAADATAPAAASGPPVIESKVSTRRKASQRHAETRTASTAASESLSDASASAPAADHTATSLSLSSPYADVADQPLLPTDLPEVMRLSAPSQHPHPRRSSPTSTGLLDSTRLVVTPDDEPVTLLHLSLLHDVPMTVLREWNPHLLAYGDEDDIPDSVTVTVPRAYGLEEETELYDDGSSVGTGTGGCVDLGPEELLHRSDSSVTAGGVGGTGSALQRASVLSRGSTSTMRSSAGGSRLGGSMRHRDNVQFVSVRSVSASRDQPHSASQPRPVIATPVQSTLATAAVGERDVGKDGADSVSSSPATSPRDWRPMPAPPPPAEVLMERRLSVNGRGRSIDHPATEATQAASAPAQAAPSSPAPPTATTTTTILTAGVKAAKLKGGDAGQQSQPSAALAERVRPRAGAPVAASAAPAALPPVEVAGGVPRSGAAPFGGVRSTGAPAHAVTDPIAAAVAQQSGGAPPTLSRMRASRNAGSPSALSPTSLSQPLHSKLQPPRQQQQPKSSSPPPEPQQRAPQQRAVNTPPPQSPTVRSSASAVPTPTPTPTPTPAPAPPAMVSLGSVRQRSANSRQPSVPISVVSVSDASDRAAAATTGGGGTLQEKLGRHLGLFIDAETLTVVRARGVAAKAEFKAGDVIRTVDGKAVASMADLASRVDHVERHAVFITVQEAGVGAVKTRRVVLPRHEEAPAAAASSSVPRSTRALTVAAVADHRTYQRPATLPDGDGRTSRIALSGTKRQAPATPTASRAAEEPAPAQRPVVATKPTAAPVEPTARRPQPPPSSSSVARTRSATRPSPSVRSESRSLAPDSTAPSGPTAAGHPFAQRRGTTPQPAPRPASARVPPPADSGGGSSAPSSSASCTRIRSRSAGRLGVGAAAAPPSANALRRQQQQQQPSSSSSSAAAAPPDAVGRAKRSGVQ